MQLLSSYLSAAAPLRHIPVGSISPSSLTQFRTAGGRSCGIKLFSSRWRRDFAGRKRLYAQSQEGVDRETLNLTDLRNLQSSSRTPEPEPLPYYAGVSEEEIREALLFEQGNLNCPFDLIPFPGLLLNQQLILFRSETLEAVLDVVGRFRLAFLSLHASLHVVL